MGSAEVGGLYSLYIGCAVMGNAGVGGVSMKNAGMECGCVGGPVTGSAGIGNEDMEN